MPQPSWLRIEGARQNNLKNVSLALPHDKVTVVTGVSGSGKSSLAFDTLFAEGQWRYVESLSTYARMFLERVDRPDVDRIEHIRPAIALEQKNPVRTARSTVGTATELYDYLRSVKPLDTDTVMASVSRTGKLLCVGESWPWGGVTAEVIARVTSEGYGLLDAPPQRLNAKDTPVPYHPNLWAAHRPTVRAVAAAARKILRS